MVTTPNGNLGRNVLRFVLTLCIKVHTLLIRATNSQFIITTVCLNCVSFSQLLMLASLLRFRLFRREAGLYDHLNFINRSQRSRSICSRFKK